jgi:hypothetical protein
LQLGEEGGRGGGDDVRVDAGRGKEGQDDSESGKERPNAQRRHAGGDPLVLCESIP